MTLIKSIMSSSGNVPPKTTSRGRSIRVVGREKTNNRVVTNVKVEEKEPVKGKGKELVKRKKENIEQVSKLEIKYPFPSQKDLKEEEVKYTAKLKFFLTTFLRRVVINEKLMSFLLDEKNMDLWCSAMTHPSYQTVRRNARDFDVMEYLGDPIMGACFSAYAVKKYPGRSAEFYSQLHMYYMSKQKEGQAKMIEKEGVSEYIRMGYLNDGRKIPYNDAVLGDVFEAIFGVLYTLGEEYGMMERKEDMASGVGILLCQRLLNNVFENVPWDEDKGYQHPKTLLSQSMSVKSHVSEIKGVGKNASIFRCQVYIPAFIVDHEKIYIYMPGSREKDSRLEKHIKKKCSPTVKIRDEEVYILSVSENYSMKKASTDAYDAAILLIKESGITLGDIDNIKVNKIKYSREFGELWKEADEKAKSELNASMHSFKTDAKKMRNEEGDFISLYARVNDGSNVGRMINLACAHSKDKDSLTTVRKELLLSYIESEI